MPYLSSTLFVTTILAALLVAMTAYFLLASALWPDFVSRAEDRFARSTTRTVLVGAPVTLLLSLICAALLQAPGGAKVLGFGVTGASLGFVLAGAAGLAARVGTRLGGDDAPKWRQVLRAGIVLELSMLLPVLGWFLVLPIVVIGGAGAATMALFSRRRIAEAAPVFAPTSLGASAASMRM